MYISWYSQVERFAECVWNANGALMEHQQHAVWNARCIASSAPAPAVHQRCNGSRSHVYAEVKIHTSVYTHTYYVNVHVHRGRQIAAVENSYTCIYASMV